ncbi:TetR/AcrR family transcriptional regulator [Leptotrichia sp. oral taxon 218]|uniref:TetR/AcrR family transcriptional regulator n=1 Tax=Leptotrichia TaxID=32067 RepID=UPI001B8B2BAF|nr:MULTISPECIES: TetR/AcrR family transcriptional regulator [Leptotrichia]QUB95501.1 TetR/AcrR family transcriptional regulator [Leptotrichia sp. oral taxon 218]
MEKIKKSYHHGNLREELIEKGIEVINEEGEEKLSLRKVAKMCGVSNAAPYTYFKKKSDLLYAMSDYIWGILAAELDRTRKKYENQENLLVKLGKTYVMFFCENHRYYHFMISRKNMKIDLFSKFSEIENNNEKAFSILKIEAIKILEKMGVPNQAMQDKIIAMWALVQGLVTIMIMNDITYSEIWEEKIEEIIKSVCIVK